jgi:hypothetical protein
MPGRDLLLERAEDVSQFLAGRLRTMIFRANEDEADLELRGIPVADRRACECLEAGGRNFARGFKRAMLDTRPDRIEQRMADLDHHVRGFGFEGAGMAMTLLDALAPPRRRLARLLEYDGGRHPEVIHIGVGWAWARMRRVPPRPPERLDPFFGWLAYDGAGFFEAYWNVERAVDEQARPPRLSPPAARIFDQGVGRCLLFVRGADLDGVRATIDRFPEERRADLWSGVGVAATYAGGHADERLRRMAELAGPYADRLAQGCAFAAMARYHGANLTEDAERAAAILCGASSATEAARRAEELREDLPARAESQLEAWQARLRETFAPAEPVAA